MNCSSGFPFGVSLTQAETCCRKMQ